MQMLSGLGKARYIPLLILFTLAIMQSCRKNPKEMTDEELAVAISEKKTYQQLLDLAGNAGIDTRKFEAKAGTQPVFGLLEELAFGHKPTIRFTQKKIKADTTLIRDAAEELVNGQSVEKVLED